jgi:tetratricopeptide (TPR) repeat protein
MRGPPGSEDPSERIGPYRLLDLLGEGGMGAVWLAEQSEPVHRRVALKILKLGMDTRQFLARLEAERQALAVMDHANIAKFYDGGATETGRPYFVMELVDGVAITEYADANRLTTDDRIRLFIDVCRAVQHAHQKGVIHRDLKPSNVLVTVQDGRPTVKVIDFGIAKALEQDLTDGTLTRLGQVVGTPAYMSPEQAEASDMDVDTRADVYSLGVLLYELLLGVLPIEMGSGVPEAVQLAIRETRVPRPSAKLSGLGEIRSSVAHLRRTSPDALRRALRGDLDWIVLKALEKDRTLRYETVNGLAEDLQRYLGHEPVLARAPSAAYRMKKFIRRYRTQVAFGGALAALLLFSAVGMAVQAARVARERDRAEGEAAKARAVNDFMAQTLLSPDPVNGLGQDATILEALDSAVARFKGTFASEPEVDATIRSSIGWAYFNLRRFDEAEPLLRDAFRIQEGMPDGEIADLAESLSRLGALMEARAEADSAESLYRSSLEIRRGMSVSGDPGTGETLIRLSDLLMTQGRYGEAEDALSEALEAFEAGEADPLEISAATNRLGNLHWIQGDLDAAEPFLRRTLAERRERLAPDHPLVAEALNDLAACLEDLGRLDEAERYYREALASVVAAFGESSDYGSSILGNLGLILAGKGETSEADSLLRRALAIDRELLGPDHPSVAVDEINLGLLLCEAGQAPEGLALTADAVGIFGKVLEPGQWEMAAARSAYGHCLGRVGRYAEGEEELLDALGTVDRALGPDHPRMESIRARLVELYEAWGRPDEAASYRSGPG